MDKKTIEEAIHNRVKNSKEPKKYTSWSVGLTHDPDARKTQHEDEGDSVKYWQQWRVDYLSDAQEIETYFINTKKMKGGTGGDLNERKATYVYIY